jgi:hypothetical protein
MECAHVFCFSRLAGDGTNVLSGPKTRRKTPATIEELHFSYPNIRDSQHSGKRRRRLKIAGQSDQQNARYEPSPRGWLHAINLLKFAPIQQLIAARDPEIR